MASYHHGNLRDAILSAAAAVIARDGVGALSLRAIAKDLGVSHTAFRRHFGSREGVLNALAVQGNHLLADGLRTAAASGDFADVGVAYVRFALAHPGRFRVMFRSDLLDNDDPELTAARAEALAPLQTGVRALGFADPTAAEVAIWGVVHGVASLALNGTLAGALDGPLNADPPPAKPDRAGLGRFPPAPTDAPGAPDADARSGTAESPARAPDDVESLTRRALGLLILPTGRTPHV